MKYLVMECHPGYAVVMDDAGRFLKVANLHYEPGQTVASVLAMRDTGASGDARRLHLRKMWISFAAAAACLCLVVLGGWRAVMSPYGSVRMQINPDVQMTVNRLDQVIGLEGLNDDGADLIAGYPCRWKKVDLVSDELADRAVEMGYLKEDGTIRITVESRHESWKTQTEERIVIELEAHMKGSVSVVSGPSDASGAGAPDGAGEIVIPLRPAQPSSDGGDDDDRDDDDDAAAVDDGGDDDDGADDDGDDGPGGAGAQDNEDDDDAAGDDDGGDDDDDGAE